MTINYFLISCFLIFLCGTVPVKAQINLDFDSLRSEIKNAETERDRINVIIHYGNSFAPSQADSIFYYADKLSHEPESNELAKAGELLLTGVALSKQSKLQEAKEPLTQAMELLEQQKEFELYFIAGNHLGRVYTRTREYKEALHLYEGFLENEDKLDAHMQKVVYGNLGIIHRRLGSFYEAVTHFEKTLELDPDDVFSVTNATMQISSIYLMLDFPEKALQTLNKIDARILPAHPIKCAYFNNKGEVFTILENVDSAIFYLSKGIEVGKEILQLHQVVKPSAGLIRLLGKKGELEKAEKVYQDVKGLCPKYCPPAMNIDVFLASAEHMMNVKNHARASTYIQEAIDIAQRTNQINALPDAYLLMAQNYESTGDEHQALIFQTKYNLLKDSINLTSRERFLAEARTRFQTDEKESMLMSSEKSNSFFQDLVVQISVLALLLLGGGMFYYKRYRSSDNLLTLKEEEIKVLNEQLGEWNQRSERVDIFPKYLILKSKAKIDLEQLQYIYVDGHYLEYFITEKQRPEIDRNSLNSIMEDLPEGKFVRVHRSYVVNLDYVRAIYSSKVMLESGMEVPVSRTYKSNIEDVLLKSSNAV